MPRTIAGPEPGHLFVFGLGYTGLRLARRLRAAGWRVSGTVRGVARAAALAADEGIAVHPFDGTDPLTGPPDFDGVSHIVDSIPPRDPPHGTAVPALTHHRAALLALPALRWLGYLSTSAVYGDRQGGPAHEDEAPTPGTRRGELRVEAEQAWLDAFAGTAVAVQIFRLAGIYGPGAGRNPLDALRKGTARIVDKPGQVFNRIHVEDIAAVLMASMARPRAGGIYNVADRQACAPGEPVRFAAGLLGVEAPRPVAYDRAELSAMARGFYSECKRLDTTLLSAELGVELAYPTYREGLRAIFEAESDRLKNG